MNSHFSHRFVLGAEMLDAGESIEIVDLSEKATRRFAAEADARNTSPTALAIRILELVCSENLFTAVLDDGQ